ncbi:MAG: DUF1553 domain-containing protein, partial [Planctomycetes bacterium]|nr:DUF1553 domain-containing protein [Planctomycetota bacterium]
DYRAYANIFGQVKYAVSPAARELVTAENKKRKEMKPVKGKQPLPPLREVFLAAQATALPDPDTNRRLPARALGGPEIPVVNSQDARVALWEWLRSEDNPYFARSFVNRVWGHYFGIGLVNPVDDFSLANPPSNPKLLDALAQDFVAHHYDIRRLERTILNARVYQLTAVPNASNRQDHHNFSHSLVRPMMAEVVADVLDSALGVSGDLKAPDLPPGVRAIEIAPSRVQNGNLAYLFRIFGRPPRTSACDCQRAQAPALPQALYLMDDPSVLTKLQAPNGRLKQLLRSNKTDDEILDELFLATLTRYPTEADRQTFQECRAQSKDRQTAFVTTLWALINLKEFILNH